MAASLDRARFFASARTNPFPRAFTQGQVDGLGWLLDACPPDLPTDHLAYALATCPVETAWTMQPIKEKGSADYLRRMYDIQGERPAKARELGNLSPGDGARYCGRGYVQLTGRSNYRRATTRLRALGYILPTEDPEATPDLAMRHDVAAAVMFVGMAEGWFTGKKLADYFGPGRQDATGARRIINGQDRAAEIAQHFAGFRAALVAAGHAPGAVTTRLPVEPISAEPIPAPGAKPPVPAYDGAPKVDTKPALDALTRATEATVPAPPVQPGGLFSRIAARLRAAYPVKG